MLQRLMESNRDLYAAFFDRDRPERAQACKQVGEEAAELMIATMSNETTMEDVADEVADVIYVALGAARAIGLRPADIVLACERVIAKNAEKRPVNGYGLNDKGKIARLKP